MSDYAKRPTNEQLAEWKNPGDATTHFFPAYYEPEHEQYLQGLFEEIAESRAEIERLGAQVYSLTHKVHPCSSVPVSAMPDDTEADEAIAEAESFSEAMFEIAEKYEIPLTNNIERWQDGVFVRHVVTFTGDVAVVANRFFGTEESQRAIASLVSQLDDAKAHIRRLTQENAA